MYGLLLHLTRLTVMVLYGLCLYLLFYSVVHSWCVDLWNRILYTLVVSLALVPSAPVAVLATPLHSCFWSQTRMSASRTLIYLSLDTHLYMCTRP
jgi:hypothetical protein